MKRSKMRKEVEQFLEYIHPGSKNVEVCLIHPEERKSKLWNNESVSGRGIVSGWFDNHHDVSEIVKEMNSVHAEGSYVSLNPCKKILKERADGRLKTNISRTKDNEISKIENILLDIDPIRPSGVSSSKKEHKLAIKLARTISKDLKKLGFPDPLLVDSGNGAHLIFKTKLKNNDQNVHLIKSVLGVLAHKYNTPKVKVDTSVYNPSRLVKLAGTYTHKGDDLPDRPHRPARILKMPKNVKRVKIDQLEKLAASVPKEPEKKKSESKTNSNLLDVKAYLKHYDVPLKERKPYRGGNLYALEACLFNPKHKPNKASIIQSSEGTLYYQCFHNSCGDKRWQDARKRISGDDKLDQFFKDAKNYNSDDIIQYATMNGEEMLRQRINETPLINGLLEKTGSLLIVGKTGMMKSMITLNIALNMANPAEDNRLWGIFDIPKKVKTLFIQSENSIYGTKKRLQQMILSNKRFKNALRNIVFPIARKDCRITGDIKDKQFQEAVKELIFKTRARLIVIDPFISFHNQDENNNAEIRKALDALTELCDVTKTACILVHHSGKEAPKDVFAGRGASAIADWAGNIILLNEASSDGNKWISVSHVKSRNFERIAPFTLEVSGTLEFTKVDSPTDKKQNIVVEVLKSLGGRVDDQGTFKAKIEEVHGYSTSTAGRMIETAVEADTIDMTKEGKKISYSLKKVGK